MTKLQKHQMTKKTQKSETSKAWTFFTNHAHILIVLSQYPGITLREVAIKVGITERAVQKIIDDLEQSGFIEREKLGRSNQYKLILNKPLRHPIEAHKSIKDIIHLIIKK